MPPGPFSGLLHEKRPATGKDSQSPPAAGRRHPWAVVTHGPCPRVGPVGQRFRTPGVPASISNEASVRNGAFFRET